MATNGSAYYLNRANHTGTQLLNTISNAGTLAALSAVTTTQITDGTIVNADIADGTITATKLNSSVAAAVLDTLGTTRGSILYRGASGWTVLTPGSLNYGLVSGGAGLDPSYQPVAVLSASSTFTPQQTFTAGIAVGNAGPVVWNNDLYLTRHAAATLQLGQDAVGIDATPQIIKAADTTSGGNRNGGNLIVASGNSTGTGTSVLIFATPAAGSAGTTPRTAVERVRIDSTGVWIENTTAPASNPAVGAFILYVDPSDNTLRARGSSGTVTILANP